MQSWQVTLFEIRRVMKIDANWSKISPVIK